MKIWILMEEHPYEGQHIWDVKTDVENLKKEAQKRANSELNWVEGECYTLEAQDGLRLFILDAWEIDDE